MKTVYILQSISSPEHFYSGISDDVHRRLREHNEGKLPSTIGRRPWRLKTCISFTDDERAFAFEKYLKSGSGRAFAKKRL